MKYGILFNLTHSLANTVGLFFRLNYKSVMHINILEGETLR